MKNLILKIFILGLLVIFSFILIIIFSPPDRNGYLSAIIDKHKLLESIKQPRLIFVGGSNLALGLDSSKIEKELKIPVVNMGLHAGLGLKYMLEDIKSYLKQGDILVIIPEYEHFYSGFGNGDGTLNEALRLYPKNVKYLNFEQYKKLIINFPQFIRKSLQIDLRNIGEKILNRSLREEGNSRKAFNQNGDYIGHLNVKDLNKHIPNTNLIIISKNTKIDNGMISFLNNFKVYATEKSISIYYIFPCIPDGVYKNNKNEIIEFYNYLKSNINITIISNPGNYVFQNDNFFDTVYHLNIFGRAERTKRIVNDLKKVLKISK